MDLGSGSADFVNGSDGHIRLLALIAAGLAAESTQMRVNIVIINIFTAASGTFAGIRQVDVTLYADRGVQAEINDLIGQSQGQGGGERLFRVQDQSGLGNPAGTDPDLLQRIFNAAVTVHLVTEQVGDHDRFGMHQGNDLFQGRFITLQNRVMGLGLSGPGGIAGQFRCNSGQQIGAGFIEQTGMAGLRQGMLDHIAGSRLAVGAGDYNDFHAFRSPLQNLFRDPHGHLAGDRGTAFAGLS